MKVQNIGAVLELLQALEGVEKVNVKTGVCPRTVEKMTSDREEAKKSDKVEGFLNVMATIIEKISEVEKQKIGEPQQGEEVNSFGRIEPNFELQSEQRFHTIVSYLLSLEVGIAKRINGKSRGEIVKEYLNTFTANELANLLVTRNSSN